MQKEIKPFAIQDSIEIKIEQEFHQAGKSRTMGVEHSWNSYITYSFKIEGDVLKRYLANMYKLAKEVKGENHNFQMSEGALVCWDSTPAMTDYDDGQECDAALRYIQISYKGKIYDVEGARSGQDMRFITLYAFRQEEVHSV